MTSNEILKKAETILSEILADKFADNENCEAAKKEIMTLIMNCEQAGYQQGYYEGKHKYDN